MGKHKGSNYGMNAWSNSFALIVVLFILLIIIGAIFYDNDGGYGYC